MCGILCYLGEDAVRQCGAMTRALAVSSHRGPDDTDLAYPAEHVALGHNRLAILDLTDAGHQPMRLAGRDVWLIFNGEIYNYVELRDELADLGHDVVSTGDAEVILHAYAEWGRDCVRRFNGMWAFALWDGERRELFCSRDRFGVKPFYYATDARRFCAASEIKSLLALDPSLAEPDNATIYHFLARGVIDDTDRTFYRQVRQLPAAHSMVVALGREPIVWRYYDPATAVLAMRGAVDVRDAPERLRDLFEDAVRLRLRSDVPVGTCLSGGVDSSAIVGLADRLMDRRVSTFTSVYPNTDSDEGEYARAVVARYQTDARWIEPKKQDLFEVLPRMVFHQDEPTLAPGLYSQWHVMQLAHGNVKVLLDGQGGDEIFAGYLGYYADYTASLLRRALGGDLRALSRLRHEYAEIERQLGRSPMKAAVLSRTPPWAKRAYRLLRGLGAERAALVDPGFADAWAAEEPVPVTPSALGDPLNSQLLDSLTRATIPGLLRYEDRNSMAFSIEARTPFLDYRLVEYALALPAELKIRGWETKAVFRDAMRDILPPEILARRDKKGYPTPLALWLREGLMGEARELLLSPQAVQRGITDTQRVRQLLDDHEAGHADHHWQIWSLMSLEAWFRTFIDSTSVAPVEL